MFLRDGREPHTPLIHGSDFGIVRRPGQGAIAADPTVGI